MLYIILYINKHISAVNKKNYTAKKMHRNFAVCSWEVYWCTCLPQLFQTTTFRNLTSTGFTNANSTTKG